ncbi:hypothetical protein PFISCL1PPCAC_26076, partial [Pristionchus fissidentatus]
RALAPSRLAIVLSVASNTDMPHEMDRQQAAQAQQLMMQQQQYSQYAHNQNQHWQQPTQNMAYANFGMATNVDYEKTGNGEAAAYGYAAMDPNDYYAANQRAQQYMQQQFQANPAMFAQQQQQQ